MLSQYVEKVNEALKEAPDAVFFAESVSVGGGEWALEVTYATIEYRAFLFELVGSNGTLADEPADDLWSVYSKIMKEAGVPA